MKVAETKPDLIAASLSAYDPALLFKPVKGYALQPLPEAFINMQETLRQLFKKHNGVKQFDATAFYSRRRSDLSDDDEESLAVFNQAAFTAAESIGGLVVYYQGHVLQKIDSIIANPKLKLGFKPDCLSFCIWETRKQAVAGASVAPHRKAVSRTHMWYENFALKKYTIDATDLEAIVFREFTKN